MSKRRPPLTPVSVRLKRRRDNPEQRLQIAVAEFLGYSLRAPTWWSAIGHGGGGGLRGKFLKAMGVKRGIADLLIIHPREPHRTLGYDPYVVWIELKSEDGDQSEPQDAFQEAMEATGCLYYVARSVDEVEGFLRGVGIPLHARIAA